MSQNPLHIRACVTDDNIRAWISEVKIALESSNILNIDDSQVFNYDKSVLYLSPQGDEVLVRRDDKVAYSFVSNDEKQCITGNAAGVMPPPVIMFTYVRIPAAISKLMPKD